MHKGRELSRGTTLFPNQKIEHFFDFALLGANEYPMITEEAGFPLVQKPSHRAQSPKLSPGTRVKDFIIFNIFHNSISSIGVNSLAH